MKWNDEKSRCKWANPQNEKYIHYHDKVWGAPVYDDRTLFEMLILEGFQAGLTWECILNKQEAFEKAFDNFDVKKVAKYDDTKVEELRQNAGIVRNRRKIEAAIINANVFIDIQTEFGSFSKFLWSFTDNKIVYEIGPTHSELSDRISKELKNRGMKFVGTTIIYAYLQAVGVIFAHEEGCFVKK